MNQNRPATPKCDALLEALTAFSDAQHAHRLAVINASHREEVEAGKAELAAYEGLVSAIYAVDQ